MNKKVNGEKIFEIVNYSILTILCVITLYPFIHITAIAFSTQAEAMRPGLHLWPREIDTSSFEKIFSSDDIWNAYYNTLHRTIIGTVLSVFTTGMGAYALSKKYLPLRKFFMGAILFTMYFSGGTVPNYLLMRGLGLLNNRWSMILPSLVWGFNLIIMRNFFQSIPESIEESARIDGASDWLIFIRIVVPLSMPVIATVALWMAVYHWNAYFDNLMYINDNNKYVLQRMIRNLIIESNIYYSELTVLQETSNVWPESLKSATILISTIPILVVYPFAQKYFVKGVMVGAVKG
ncbi:carbohydrate ABC transporter permease [Mahella australiensis]|uniref:Binding-protein-dependent transport systems inner membrane component n=1 Tax=Mahella australiensis (strain DSM 15567 / CIP 107919 / 50-1 BON) TaxID=697281 RepID=F3ZZA1_MAHA5|nr:carbohydrate ABC transporter permease [Mahella australiensis]AEE97883.1 binding-protein-dependent transport systems inner membrane component [Mahella australiensis 50-1 BON]